MFCCGGFVLTLLVGLRASILHHDNPLINVKKQKSPASKEAGLRNDPILAKNYLTTTRPTATPVAL